MPTDDSYEAPFSTDESEPTERERISAADFAVSDDPDETSGPASVEDAPFEDASVEAASAQLGDSEADSQEDDAELAELARPFVGRWNDLISTTNWEKGRIISQWRQALIDSGADSQQHSDEAWARRVGGVTAPHVGRLRRVHDRFASTYQTYEGLYWSHFLAALDWDDAPLWLEGASREKWSVSRMREQRWQAHGAVESNRPMPGEIVTADTDEDVVLPAQGGGRTKEYDDDSGVASGPVHEGPDFGDEEELMSLGGETGPPRADDHSPTESSAAGGNVVQPFAGLPELPDDLADAIELLKLAVLRHKTTGWAETNPETIQRYLDAVAVMMR